MVAKKKTKKAKTTKSVAVKKKVKTTASKKVAKKVTKKVTKKKPTKGKVPKSSAPPKKALLKKAKPKKSASKSTPKKSAPIPQVGTPAPSFSMLTDRGETVSKEGLLGQRVILYFYPKDDTPGCTREACEFQENLGVIARHDAVVIGVSADTGASHQKFRNKYSLAFPLGIDSDLKVAQSFGVWVEKNMYGKKSMGIQRATFLIDRQGQIAAVWPKVKVEGHVQAVLETLATIP